MSDYKNAIIECVPNFSEGRNLDIIKQITHEIEQVEGVKLLDVDPGKATNRTVVTFVGEPNAVIEAAFKAIKKADSKGISLLESTSYFAYSTALVSRMTVTLIWPG